MVSNEEPKRGLKQLIEKMDKEKKDKRTQQAKITQKTKPNYNSNSYQPTTLSFKGLTNFGNSCYSNVIIQCLASIKEFYTLLSSIYSQVENNSDLTSEFPFLSSIVEIVNLYQMKNPALSSDILKQLVSRFDSSGEQNDAHEFLVHLIDKLNEEIIIIESKFTITNEILSNPVKDKEEGEWEEVKKGNKRMKQTNSIQSFQISSLAKVFQGILKHDIQSKGQSLSQCQIEPFFTLPLDIGSISLQGAFDSTFSKKKIEKSTNQDSDKYMQTYLEQIPQILIIQLKAFYFEKKTMQVIKVTDPIAYDVIMSLKKDYFSPSLRNEYNNIKYELISVITHKGTKASEGHYICFCKEEKGSWYYLDDKKVIKVSESALKSTRPYLLFFRRL